MALFGRQRDISFMIGVNRELLHDVVEQQIDYYKPYLPGTKSKDAENLYGEASAQKTYLRPVRLNCLITYDPDSPVQEDIVGIDFSRVVTFAFIREDLVDLQLISELGDIIEYRGKFFEVNDVNEGQFVMGKDRVHPKSVGKDFGRSVSIIAVTHQTNVSRLQITRARF